MPIIHCPRGGAAEHIASALDEKIRGALKARNNLFSESSGAVSSLSRPLLILFERNFDLSAAVQHTWSYKPLVQVCALIFCFLYTFTDFSSYLHQCHWVCVAVNCWLIIAEFMHNLCCSAKSALFHTSII